MGCRCTRCWPLSPQLGLRDCNNFVRYHSALQRPRATLYRRAALRKQGGRGCCPRVLRLHGCDRGDIFAAKASMASIKTESSHNLRPSCEARPEASLSGSVGFPAVSHVKREERGVDVERLSHLPALERLINTKVQTPQSSRWLIKMKGHHLLVHITETLEDTSTPWWCAPPPRASVTPSVPHAAIGRIDALPWDT